MHSVMHTYSITILFVSSSVPFVLYRMCFGPLILHACIRNICLLYLIIYYVLPINYWFFLGNPHLAPSSDHAMRHNRHEAMPVVNHLINPSQMQQAKFGTSQPQVPLSTYTQNYQFHQPQPSTIQVPQFSQFRAAVDGSYTGTLCFKSDNRYKVHIYGGLAHVLGEVHCCCILTTFDLGRYQI